MIKRPDQPDVPWITPDGYLDMSKIPLESVFQNAVGKNKYPRHYAFRGELDALTKRSPLLPDPPPKK